MSTSTVFLKTPNYSVTPPLRFKCPEKSSSTLLIVSLWLITSIIGVTKSEFSANVTGISISFNVQDVLFMLFTCWLLQKGFSTRNVVLVLPWMILTTYGLYYNDYRGILKMMNILKHLRGHQPLPWLTIFFKTIALFIRILLTLRILQLSANLWYRKKLEKELYI